MEAGRGAVAMLYTTFPDPDTAERVGEALVERGLAACVNILPGMRSIYRWQGRIERAGEVVMIVKTGAERTAEAIAAIEAAHPYDTPAIMVLDVAGGSRRYLDWVSAESTPGGE